MSVALAQAIDRYTARPRRAPTGTFYPTALDTLTLVRAEAPSLPAPSLYAASLCVVAQGAKQASVGAAVMSYGPGDYLAVALDTPIVGHVTQATPESPYLAAVVALDPVLLADVAQQAGVAPRERAGGDPLGVFVGRLPAAAADALVHLVGLLETPEALPVLTDSVMRELAYWLLTGPDGPALARAVGPDWAIRRVAAAVQAMKAAFPEPVRIDALAAASGLSASSLYAHFKAATALTPGQYYKRLRLLEARRLLARGETARETAYHVGYESPSQFSRDYARFFGAPPARDAAAVRAAPQAAVAR